MRNKKRYTINFPRHLAICEFNYRRLLRLMPEQDQSSPQWRYWVGKQHASDLAVVISTAEQARYTTTVHIDVHSRLQKRMPWVKYPQIREQASQSVLNASKLYSLEVRLYHDATVAEVIAWEGHRRIQPRNEYPNRHMYQRDEKAQLNDFLGELLEYCLLHGRVMQDIVARVE